MIISYSHPLTIKCECGARIAISQDTTKMGQIIKEHGKLHGKDMINPTEAEKESNRVQDFLIKQVFLSVIEH